METPNRANIATLEAEGTKSVEFELLAFAVNDANTALLFVAPIIKDGRNRGKFYPLSSALVSDIACDSLRLNRVLSSFGCPGPGCCGFLLPRNDSELRRFLFLLLALSDGHPLEYMHGSERATLSSCPPLSSAGASCFELRILACWR